MRSVTTLLVVAAALGCARPSSPPPIRAEKAAADHGYALLYTILDQERQVSKILLIKEERDPLEKVIDAISDTCGTAYDRLGELAKRDPRLDLSDTGLPADEARTRQAIADARRDLLLAASGREFEFQLLLTQNEAMTYATNLADTLSRSERDPERLAFVRALWKDLTRLEQDVQGLLRHPMRAER